jgi:Ca-activated chloride channel family protein
MQPGTLAEAVDEFDQQGEAPDPDAEEQGGEGDPQEPGKGRGNVSPMMEQWLEQIEGDPAYLLRNQFMMEEQRTLRQRGGGLRETRPW